LDALVRAHLKESIPHLVASLRMRVQSGGSWKSEAYLRNRNGG
jgi:hypothetical protein